MDKADRKVLPIRIRNAPPDRISIEDLITLLENYERAIKKLSKRTTQITISLIGIGPGSTVLETTSHQFVEYKEAYTTFTEEVKLFLSGKSMKAYTEQGIEEVAEYVKRLVDLARKRNLEIEFDNEEGTPLAEITPESTVPSEKVVEGITEIYGRVERAGGVEPHIRLRLPDGEAIRIDADEKTVKKLGERLYEYVGLRGKAKWTLRGELKEFRMLSVLPYEGPPSPEDIKRLSAELGKFWQDVDNIDEEIRRLRS